MLFGVYAGIIMLFFPVCLWSPRELRDFFFWCSSHFPWMFVPLDSRIKAKQMTGIMDLSPDAPYSRKKEKKKLVCQILIMWM